ncbi:MAG: hypothetical protein D6723_07765 [Acidobacteria bacterium]|nr:MAG: hypothetical protein D6723_07765 [Acidobacteriota bacterium]
MAGYAILLWMRSGSPWLSDAGVLLASIAGAFILGSLLKTKGAIVAFCAAAAGADILSFSGGLTRHLLDQYRESSGVLPYLAIFGPIDSESVPIIGMGDLIVTGALFLALERIGFRAPEGGTVLIFTIVAALIVGWIVGGIAALPFVAVGVIAYVGFRSRRRVGIN